MIVIVFPQLYGVHGIARYLQSFLAAMDEPMERIVVIAGDDEERTLDAPANVEFVHLPLPAGRLGLVRWSLAVRRWLIVAARREPISVVNLHIPPLLPGLFLPKVGKIVVTAHTTYLGMSGQFQKPRQFRSQWNPLSVWVKKLFEHIIFARAEAVVTLTEQGRQEVRTYGFNGPIEIAPNGVMLDVFTPNATVPKSCDVLFAGRIEKRKGSRPMVDVCRALIARKPDIRICVVGYGDDFDHVKAELGSLVANVELTGKLPFESMLDKYRRSRLYASTSYYEGLPGTCLEAMAVGLPAVVWDYLFYRDLVVDGETGRLVAPNNIDGFADAVIELLGPPRNTTEMGEAARRRVALGFGWKKIAGDLLRIFQRIAG